MSKFIPDELKTEILLRVPVKSLLRFRQVCRRWRTIISSHNFIKKHLSLSSFGPSKTLLRLFTNTNCKEIYRVFNDDAFNFENYTRISYPFNENSMYYFRIVGYCNGVLCLSDCYDTSIILWNPSIKRAITLPTPTVWGNYYYALGFGYDAKNDDHKVVRLGYLDYERLSGVEVFSVSSEKWARVKPGFEKNIKTLLNWEHVKSPAVYDGIVHWAGYDAFAYYRNSMSMMTFDLNSEEFGELGLPSEVVQRLGIKAIVIKGLLSVLDFDDRILNHSKTRKFTSSCTIWVMKDYGNVGSWAKLYRIDLDGKLGQVLGMKREGEIVCGVYGESAELVTYNCENMTTTTTGIRGANGSFFVDDYVESLVLLGKGKEVSGKEDEEIKET